MAQEVMAKVCARLRDPQGVHFCIETDHISIIHGGRSPTGMTSWCDVYSCCMRLCKLLFHHEAYVVLVHMFESMDLQICGARLAWSTLYASASTGEDFGTKCQCVACGVYTIAKLYEINQPLFRYWSSLSPSPSPSPSVSVSSHRYCVAVFPVDVISHCL